MTNRIISCSFDKNIYVWDYNVNQNVWKPTMVAFKSKLSILQIKWNSQGEKFVAGSGSNMIIVGYFDKENNWWKAEDFKFHKSAVTTVGFDSTGNFVITGSTDLKIAIHSVKLKNDNNKNNPVIFSEENDKVRFYI